jgi:hypothetical protein
MSCGVVSVMGSRESKTSVMKTEVCITIDTEFSIAGAFASPQRFSPIGEEIVNCSADGRDEGLGFILETLARFGATATFFIETLQIFYFGDGPMGRIAERIAAAGHDVQLHMHPCWLQFRQPDWRNMTEVPTDSCAGLSDGELDDIIGFGMDAFARWGLPVPVALRTGGFLSDRAVYRAMARARLHTASNVALGVNPPEDASLHLSDGRHFIERVLELPALSYQTPLSHRWRTFAVTATSSNEMQYLLWQAREVGISPVVILTHPFEFIKKRDFRYRHMRRNRVNQRRLEGLLEFLQTHDDDFSVVTFGRRADSWNASGPLPATGLKVPFGLAVARTAQNAVNDLVWAY